MTAREITPIELRFEKVHPLRAMWRFLAGQRGRLGLALLVFLVKHSPAFVLPVITAQMINIAANPAQHAMSELWFYAGLMLFITLQNIPTHILYASMFSKSCRAMEARLRGSIIRRLQQLSISYHDDTQSGRLQSKVLRDVEATTRLLEHFINGIYPGLISIIFALIITLYKEPRVALFFVVVGPVASILLHIFRRRMRERNKAFRTNIEAMSGQVAEMIQMIPIARAHAVEEQEIRRMDQTLDQVKTHGYRLDILNAAFGCSFWATWSAFRLSCLAVTCYMNYKGWISVGDIFMYQGFFEIILNALGVILGSLPMMTTGFESIRSIGEVLDCPDVERNEGRMKVRDVKGRFEFENVTFAYKNAERPAVGNLSLVVEPGESIAFVGESGAGKSTVMSLIIGFHRPTSGRILLDGRDMETLDLRTYRRQLAVVPQSTLLFSGSVRENIAYGMPEVADAEIREAIKMANAEDFIDDLPDGLDTSIGEHGAKLSGGQRQRIAIARALIRNPKVIILDEATSALDVYSESLVQEAIERLISGRTTFVVAHRLSTIRICSRVVVMKDGQAIEIGTHAELMDRQGEFHKLKTLQV